VSKIYLQNCTRFDGLEIKTPVSLLLNEKKRILELDPSDLPSDIKRLDCSDLIAIPGFFDLQVNGGKGYFFNELPSFETAQQIQMAHQTFGTKDILITFITDHKEKWDRVLQDWSNLSSWPKGIAGLHLEGPFLSPKKPGVHSPNLIRKMDEADVRALIQLKEKIGDGVLLLTVAPEEISLGDVQRLVDAGIILFAGHSNANFEEASAFFKAGGHGATHLYNAMSGLSAREPGLIGAVLNNSRVATTIIADGYHVHETMLALAKGTRPIDKMILVSDAMPSAAGGPSAFTLQGKEIHTESGRSVTKDGVLSGSAVTLLDSIRYAHFTLGWSLEDCFMMTYTAPWSVMGREIKASRLQVGESFDDFLINRSLETLVEWF
jgi:N-acetylglucosamine-6-phosphate deacetylase